MSHLRSPDVVVRARRPDDVRRLVEVLAEQQPVSRYPVRWPFPYPLEDFLVRQEELAAWTVALRGVPVGLHDTAVGWIRSAGRGPCLEVFTGSPRAHRFYRGLGWQDIALVRPAWLPAGEPPVAVMWLPPE